MADAPAAPQSDFARIRRRADRIWTSMDQWRATLDVLQSYIAPMRRDAMQSGGTPAMDKIFDGTGMKANFRFAGRLQQDLTPPDERCFELGPGPMVKNADDRRQLTLQLGDITDIVDATFSAGTWGNASFEMYADLFAGQGAMLCNPGTGAYDDLICDVAVPAAQIALAADGYGRVKGIVWRRDQCADDIPELFPKASFPDALAQKIKAEQDKKLEVTHYTARDPATGRWHHRGFIKGFDRFFDDTNSRTSPWLVPRFFVLPGIAQGFGVGHLALPFVKTANKARELALKAAAFALLGLWAQRDDGVFDPDTARFAPGAFWKVGSTGGPLGPSVQKLDIPHNFDISNIVLEDERTQIKEATFDDTLPPLAGAVHSPTEIIERMRRLDMDWAGVDGRLGLEIVRAAVARRLDILEQKKILPTNLTIDQLLVKCSITSPIARARRTRAAQTAVEALTVSNSLVGAEITALLADVSGTLQDVMRDLGLPEKRIYSEADAKALQVKVATLLAQQVSIKQSGHAAAPPPPSQPLPGQP